MNICTNCYSDQTYITKKGHSKWIHWKGKLVCQKCWNNLNYKENPKKIQKIVQNWINRNKGKSKEYHKKWVKKNPSKMLSYNKNYLKKHNLMGWMIRLWANLVKQRDHNTCVICGKTANHAHHIFHKSKFPELALNLNNGITLCVNHHNEVHAKNLKPSSYI